MLRSSLAAGLTQHTARCRRFPASTILTATSISDSRQLITTTSPFSLRKFIMPPKQATLGQFFTLPPGTKPAPQEQTKLSTRSISKGSKAKKNDNAGSSAVKKTVSKSEPPVMAEDEDEAMDDAPPAMEESLGTKTTEKEKPKTTSKKRGRSPSDSKSAKPSSKKPEVMEDSETEIVDVEPVVKKRGKLVKSRKEKALPNPPRLEDEKEKVTLVKENALSESESETVKPRRQSRPQKATETPAKEEAPTGSESESVKPRRRGKPPKAADVTADMQKVKLSEKETNKAKTVKKENDKPEPEPESEPESAPKKTSGPTSKPSKKTVPTVKQEEPAEEKNTSLASELEAVSSDGEDSLKKPAITVAARKAVQAKLAKSQHPYPDWPPGSPVPYAAVCKSFALIEATSSRLEKLQHASLLLRQVLRLTPNELLLVIHLMCNKLAADFEGIELGIGESLLMKAIAESCGRALDKIRADHNQIGDLGAVAQQSRSNQSTLQFKKPKPLTVPGVHGAFFKIATTAGTGSQQGKVSMINNLLANAAKEGDEAKYIVRALEGKMRLGLAERTIEVSLSQAVVTWEQQQLGKQPSLAQLQEAEEIIKGVYSELPSYEVIIPALIEHGISKLREKCKMQPGVPLKPMLAKPTKAITEVLDKFENKSFTCEYKYDGERSQIHFVSKDSSIDYPKTAIDTNKTDKGVAKIFSRNSEDLSKKYPDILGVLDTWIKPGVESFILDCETVGWDKERKKVLPFQDLMKRKKKNVAIGDVQIKVCVFAFDLLFLNGKPLVKETLEERRRLMHESFTEVEEQFLFAKAMEGNELEQIQAFLDESIKDSCEGLMVKMFVGPESRYEPSVRSINWLKIKKDYLAGVGDSLDLVVVGAYFGRGKRTSVYGAFLLACYNTSKQTYETICNIGTGFSEQVLEELYKALSEHVISRPKPYYSHSSGNKDAPDVWFEPKMVWEVKTADMTLSPKYRAGEGLVDPEKGISLRFPRFLKIREDKGPEDATNSRQVAEMYRKQEAVSGGKKGVDDDFEY